MNNLTPIFVNAQIRYTAQKLKAQGVDPAMARDYFLEQMQIEKRKRAMKLFRTICEYHFEFKDEDYDT